MATIAIISSIFIIVTLFLIFDRSSREVKKRQAYITNFESYAAVLEYHLQKAYDIIYKDRILIYSLEATKLSDEEFGRVLIDFGKLVLKMLGPTLQKEFFYLYGNEETLLFIVTEYFSTRYEDDEIRKASIGKLMEEEEPEDLTA